MITYIDSVVKRHKKAGKGLTVNFFPNSTNNFTYLCHGNLYQSPSSTSAKVSAVFVADEKHLQSANLIARSGDSMHKNIEQLRFEEELITL